MPKQSKKGKNNSSKLDIQVPSFEEKEAINEKYNSGYSIPEIAKQLKISEKIITEYVDSIFITFNGEEGEMVLGIIHKLFGNCPIVKLQEMIATKNVKLQKEICCELPSINGDEFKVLKEYFLKFEQSQNFFEINETLSIEERTCIRTSSLDNIQELSLKLNRMEKMIREYLLRYSPDQEFLFLDQQEQLKLLQKYAAEFEMDRKVSYTTYRMIISDTFDDLIQNANTCSEEGKSLRKIFNELLALALYYIKCSLPLDELTEVMANITNISLTTLDIFHLIFQMSDPVVRGLCIEHYSFSNPVPFYYPMLQPYSSGQTSSQFEICKELWYSIQQFSGLVSFGLGWASWNPIGKSHLLDLMFKTDFLSPQSSPFHLGSIDIQMTKNLFGKKDKSTQESTQWAYIDCHRYSDFNVIKDICQNLDIALIHVSYSDYRENYSRLMGDLAKITNNTQHIYVLVRDCTENNLNTFEMHGMTHIFIPNLIKHNIKIVSGVKKIGYKILHSPIPIPRLVGNNFLENMVTQNDSWTNLVKEKRIIDCIKSHRCSIIQDRSEMEFSFLSYYPHFVKYMDCFYEASTQTNQKATDEFNGKCEQLANHLENAEMNAIVWQFNEILARENSTLILWKLSQELKILEGELPVTNKTPFTLEILWREALLSSKYNVTINEGKLASNYFKTFSSNFSNHVKRGEPFELIDGDNLRFFNQDINVLLSKFYEQEDGQIATIIENKRPPIVVSIFGPQSSGKSTLLNYCFGCKFLTSAGRCTKGIYASLSKLSQPINNSDHFLILDTEGLDATEKAKTQKTSGIHFDRTMVLFCLAVSQVVIINVKGDLGEKMQNLLQICAYSLNKLKVSKVATPQILFVLNQQADPDPDKHLNSITILLEKLNEESYLMETEGLKISDLIQVSKENLFVLPSAFNSESVNTQMTKLFDSNLCKLFPTIDFANRCANLRMSIILQLKDDTFARRTPFNTMSEWMEMSGVIWDTIIKYQDIVKYRNTEELKCSNELNKMLSDIIKNLIHSNKENYLKITKKSIVIIKEITKSCPPKEILEYAKKELYDVFKEDNANALADFAAQCQANQLLKRMDYLCDEAESNLNRLIYREKKVYRDQLNLAIKARLIEIKLSECMEEFQLTIEKNSDKYLELSIEEQKGEFEELWAKYFSHDTKEEEEMEYDEKFDNLYSLFKMESKTMENKQMIYALFRNSNFDIDSIIQKLGNSMISKFCEKSNQYAGTDQFIYPWRENRVPLKDITPYSGRFRCEYISKESLYHRIGHQDKHTFKKINLKFREWVPKGCYPLIKYCSGYYNHPDIIWKLEKRKQILLLASELKDPNDFGRSTWHKFIADISKRIQGFTKSDPNISHSTVKEIVDFLHHICKIVNYEINFIEAKLTNAAERNISTYAFAFAFKSLLNTKIDLQKESKSKENERKQNNLKYLLQKVENQKLARGNFDRKERRKGDKAIANKYAEDLLAAVWRGVNADCEQSITEKYFRKKKDQISHKSILLLANDKITEELNQYYSLGNNPIEEDNIIIQYTCNRIQYLKRLFKEEWMKVANELQDEIVRNMRDIFTEQIATLKHVLTEFLERLIAKCKELDRLEDIGSDSDSNFEVADHIVLAKQTPHNPDSKMRDAPLKAMVFFLKHYLNPNVNPEEFNKLFDDVFEVNGVKMEKIHPKFVLSEKEHNPAQLLDEEMYKKLRESNMFSSTETIFNIKVYIQQFLRTLTCYEYKVTEVEYEQILNSTRKKFEADVINCPHQCPSCGKFCEREIHPNEGKCRIMTGHQICSMGGNVWNNNEDKTAILLMCEDYNDDTPVLIPAQNMKWWEFKEKCGDQWDWTLPTEEKYVTLQENNRFRMKKIWNKYGRKILNFYANRGITITYIPYTYPEDIYTSLFSRNYYICFVIDGTVETCQLFSFLEY